jgi:predicted GIY-YIG superfamily endonuclease
MRLYLNVLQEFSESLNKFSIIQIMGSVYLLHFSQPISNKHTTQHYLGWASNLKSRITKHQQGQGARLTKVAYDRSITFEVACTWEGDRQLERLIKRQKNHRRYCPICRSARRY